MISFSLLFHSFVVQSLSHVCFLWPRLPCPLSPRLCSNSCPLSQWCHPTISSSVVPFSSCPQSFPASKSFPMRQFFTSCGQSIGTSASASVLPMNVQGWFPFTLLWLLKFSKVCAVRPHLKGNILPRLHTQRILYFISFSLSLFPSTVDPWIMWGLGDHQEVENSWINLWLAFSSLISNPRTQPTFDGVGCIYWKKNLHVSEPEQFKLMWFKGHYIHRPSRLPF